MNKSIFVTSYLVIAGLIGLYVGIGLTFFPVELQEGNGILLLSASHFSETRAPGSAILIASIFMVVSIFRSNWRSNTLGLASLFFLSYGFGRLFSLMVDGKPADGLYYAMFGEILLGVIAMFIMVRMKKY